LELYETEEEAKGLSSEALVEAVKDYYENYVIPLEDNKALLDGVE
jgi:hypothetical protein